MGALTNKPMAFNSRNWEYNSQITKDLTDFLSPKIRVDQFSGKIYRILPTVEWISNKIRFLYMGLKNQRVATPLLTYNCTFDFDLADRNISYSKKAILTTRFEKAFNILKARINNKRKKNINLVLGSVFDANFSFINSFEKKNITKVNKYLEFPLLESGLSKFSEEELLNSKNILLFGVNPRMESPLLNLKIRDSNSKVLSVGNFSFNYNVDTIGNNNYINILVNKGKFLIDSFALFGLATLNVSKSYMGKKSIILPLSYLNNLVNSHEYSKNVKEVGYNKDDVNVLVAPQNLQENYRNNKNLNFIISTHFEKVENLEQNVRLPVAGYLETNFKFYNKDLKLESINSIKPSFGLSDLSLAFMLYTNRSNFSLKLKGSELANINKSYRIDNVVISNTIPNYLVREPLGRANPLFNKI